MENKLGSGLIYAPPSPKDYKLSFLASAPAPIDWDKGLFLPEPPDSNQAYADCCVAEATSYFHWQVTGKKFSVRSIFAYIAQSRGAYFKDGPDRLLNYGQETHVEAPDPQPKDYNNMRSKVGLNPERATDDKILRYFSFPASIEQTAQAIRDWKGGLVGIQYYAPTWTDLTNPNPAPPNTPGEGHAIYGFGYHMHDGQKCVVFKSSWCGAQPGHHVHHIKENYFNSGYIFDQGWVIVKGSSNIMRFIVQKGGKLGVLVSIDGDGIFTDVTFWAKSEEHFAQLKKQYEVPDNAPRIVYPV